MKRTPALAVLSILLGSIAAVDAQAGVPPAVGDAQLPSLSPMIKRVSPAIVNVATRGTIKQRGEASGQNPLLEDPFFRRFFNAPPGGGGAPRDRPFQSAGSGVIFDAKSGYIVTNAHVIENASEITVTLQDGRDLKAEVVGSDELSDIAVLKVASGNLVQMPLGDSSHLEVGDFVVAIGNPFGLQHTVTSGIVSGLSRSGINPDGIEDFIQTDASINPGNSGGALVNLRGELIGINSAILSGNGGGNIGIGFAIPVNMAHSVMDQLLKYGSVKRGLLGVNTYPVRPDIAQALGLKDIQGALVTQVIEGSAAAKAGIQAGDIITSINEHPVKSPPELRNMIQMLRVGDRVNVELLRDGKPRRLTALIADPAAVESGPAESPTIHKALEGATIADAPNGAGALVRDVAANSPAAQAGLRENDIIVGVNRAKVASLAQLRERAGKATGSLVLEVRRGTTSLLIPLR